MPHPAESTFDRQDILQRMMRVMGDMPPARSAPPTVRAGETFTRADVRYTRLELLVDPDDWCPAWLLTPAREDALTTKQAAMLCLHQTTAIGKDEPAGLGGRDDLHYALELAQRGHIALVPDYPTLGEYHIDPYARGYVSGTMKGIWNHAQCVTYLSQLPQVDPQRLGVIGHSLGGHNALFLAAFDERVRAVVSSCGFTGFRWNRQGSSGPAGDVSDWTGPRYMPRIREQFHSRAENMPWDFTDVLAAIAPRPTFINAPVQDCFSMVGVQATIQAVLAAAPEARIEAHYPDCGHAFPTPVRQAAYEFLEQALADCGR